MARRWAPVGVMTIGVMMAATLSGCGNPNDVPGQESTATQAVETGSPEPQQMTSRDDLVNPWPIAWDDWRETAPGAVELRFVTGPDSCTGIQVQVSETDEIVTIDLVAGGLPNTGECPAIALESITTVTLAKPVGDREVRQTS